MAGSAFTPAFAPCADWTTADDVGSVCGSLEGSAAVPLAPYVTEASQLLYELSGRQFNGICSDTVRPCRVGCGCWGGLDILTGGILSAGAYPEAWGYGLGFNWGGYTWINDYGNPCGCGFLSEVELAGYPVQEILEVKIDGAAVDPDGYRVDDHRFLVRMRDPAAPQRVVGWPTCQILDLPDTEHGTWSVTYTYGTPPPEPGKQAAAQLACELYRASTGGPCSLPTGATRQIRQGVTVDRLLLSWLKGGFTGLVHVDSFLAAYNPQRLRRRPAVFNPDTSRFGRHAGD